MSNDHSIIKLGDLSKPATVLIEKISEAVGGLFKPYQIIRVAKAEVEAERIRAESQIQITDLHRRAFHRFLEEEAKKQRNIEEITHKALPQLEDKSQPEKVEDDWIINFFDKCRIVSDEEMQSLWAKVLAGEANSPGKYSKRTVNFLGSLDKTDAQLFTSLCGFGSVLGGVEVLIFDVNQPIYNNQGINFDTLSHLDDIGLVTFNDIAGFNLKSLPKRVNFFYYGIPLNVEFNKETDNELEVGKVLLTKIGRQLAPICGSKPVDGFLDYIIKGWAKKGVILSSPYPRKK